MRHHDTHNVTLKSTSIVVDEPIVLDSGHVLDGLGMLTVKAGPKFSAPALVVSARYDECKASNAEWTPDKGVVLHPVVGNIALVGNAKMSDNIRGTEKDRPMRMDAIRFYATNPLVENVTIHGFDGYAIDLQRGSHKRTESLQVGDWGPGRVSHCRVSKCLEGVRATYSDIVVDDLICNKIRGIGLDAVSATQVCGGHFYDCGIGVRCLNRSYLYGTEIENCEVGIWNEGWHTLGVGLVLWGNHTSNFAGSRKMVLSGCLIDQNLVEQDGQ